MSYTGNAAGALNSYAEVAVHSGVGAASPHRLIQMLLQAAQDKIATARGCMTQGIIDKKVQHIISAVAIVEGLRVSLDMEKGGEISENLFSLYDYMERRLTEANASNNVAILDEVINLIKPIKEAWDAIPQEVQDAHSRA
ncbi:MAG: flagellar export chaperone FliS [Gammaproteobacteria bacterium]|nr:flagellar export chaperone FliS [Gammaproteobacteria bacterium]MCF6363654.1 flagellar export chaperone FliS [Gammaproteobacteria bacterium]